MKFYECRCFNGENCTNCCQTLTHCIHAEQVRQGYKHAEDMVMTHITEMCAFIQTIDDPGTQQALLDFCMHQLLQNIPLSDAERIGMLEMVKQGILTGYDFDE